MVSTKALTIIKLSHRRNYTLGYVAHVKKKTIEKTIFLQYLNGRLLYDTCLS